MKDSVNTLFRQRFQGHEAAVDPGVWTGIEQQMAAPTPADGVNELFKDRFHGHEMSVDPAVWSGISSQLGHPVAAGTSMGTWALITAGVAAVAITAAVVFNGGSEQLPQPVAERVDPAQETIRPVEVPIDPGTTTIEPLTEDPKSGPARPKTSATGAPKGIARSNNPVRSTPPTVEIHSGTPDLVRDTALPAGDRTPESGTTVVSAIITDLEEQVRQQPITASPEPGLAGSSTPEPPPTRPEPGTVTMATTGTAEASPMPKLFMPNTFTPNGDGINDTYTVDGEGFSAILLRVYSMKSNALVFTTNSAEPWTGDGCEDGMYMVAVEARTNDGRTTTEGKVVWLNRNRIN
ncbi:MAG: gliding motility-associated C-terminal domain-containing protein [Flavobacteriales bacterium]|nr:gliding motility-associated C-terminal domain-containing protein [Flavobacteriales bacterium]